MHAPQMSQLGSFGVAITTFFMIVNVFVEPGLHPALTSTFKKAGWLLSAVRTFPNESHFTTSQLEAAVPASSFPSAWDAYPPEAHGSREDHSPPHSQLSLAKHTHLV